MNPSLRHRALSGETRSRILAALRRASEPLSLAEIAEELGMHPNTAREHLRLLADAGLVTAELAASGRRGRPGFRYSLDPAATDAGDDPRPYAQLAAVLADQLASRPDAKRAAIEAGARWGRAMISDDETATDDAAAMDRLVSLLDEAGFAPEASSNAEAPIRLRRCPFGRLAVDREHIVCGVHLGLMRGVLQSIGSSLDATRLEPFVEPDLCLAHVADRSSG